MQKLNDQGVPPNQIVQISGHKNLNSLNNYSKLNQNQAIAISDILSSGGSSSCVRFSKSENVPNVQADGAAPHGFFVNPQFFGNVTFNFNSTSQKNTLSQQHYDLPLHRDRTPGPVGDSPVLVEPKYKRIRLIDSDSE